MQEGEVQLRLSMHFIEHLFGDKVERPRGICPGKHAAQPGAEGSDAGYQ